jgi:hypothetical protein
LQGTEKTPVALKMSESTEKKYVANTEAGVMESIFTGYLRALDVNTSSRKRKILLSWSSVLPIPKAQVI